MVKCENRSLRVVLKNCYLKININVEKVLST